MSNVTVTAFTVYDSEGDLLVFCVTRREGEHIAESEEYELSVKAGADEREYCVFVSESDLTELTDYFDCAR